MTGRVDELVDADARIDGPRGLIMPLTKRPFHRRFYLYRQVDDSGVSGTGVVAHGVQYVDGTTVLRWLGDNPSTVVWPSIAAAMAVHGHGGHTVAIWLDDYDAPTRPA